jgi:hypothetical protein
LVIEGKIWLERVRFWKIIEVMLFFEKEEKFWKKSIFGWKRKERIERMTVDVTKGNHWKIKSNVFSSNIHIEKWTPEDPKRKEQFEYYDNEIYDGIHKSLILFEAVKW